MAHFDQLNYWHFWAQVGLPAPAPAACRAVGRALGWVIAMRRGVYFQAVLLTSRLTHGASRSGRLAQLLFAFPSRSLKPSHLAPRHIRRAGGLDHNCRPLDGWGPAAGGWLEHLVQLSALWLASWH